MLQQLKIDDFESLYELMEESFPPEEHRTKEDQRALFDDSRYVVWGVRDEARRVIAFMATWELEQMLFLEHFAVSPALRGQGLGAKLLAELSELAASAKKQICLEAEPPETEIAKRRIAFYRRCGFTLNEYPYIQPSMAAGQPPIPLVVMTYGGGVSKDTFDSIRDELYREVYHVTPMSREDSNRFDEMVKLAETALQKAAIGKYTQAIVWQGIDGRYASFVLKNACSADGIEEAALVNVLTAQTDGRISHLLCMWQTGSIDLPSRRLRKKLIDLHPDNATATVFVLTGGGYGAKRMEKFQ